MNRYKVRMTLWIPLYKPSKSNSVSCSTQENKYIGSADWSTSSADQNNNDFMWHSTSDYRWKSYCEDY